ncbi:amidohydrolase family protein [Cnuibacter physcomitrellae]|uniref:amidohydrolase family protein n=1 Tax=Cnuibacter physcomitrellae TaxID=1619308 RepID=UPI002175F236|nr:amidohydrolase family protein [Cnuibacter physcomitrellae]MCS5498285.1 amidohydrolase family protein [Cnuibacter physcomitrellae]
METQSIAVVGADVWPGSGDALLADQTIVTDGRRIAAIGPRATTEVPSGARIVDGAGLTVIPGLIDAHVHLSMNSDESTVKPVLPYLGQTTPQEMALHAQRNASRALAAGFTTLRVMGNRDAGERAYRDFIERGLAIGPRLVITPWWISMTNGHGDLFYPSYFGRRELDTADGVDGVRRMVRILAREGADFIKVMASGGLLSAGDKASWRNYTVAELSAIVDEAHSFDMKVAAHATGLAGIRNSLEAGVDSIEHGTYLEQDEVDRMVEQGTVLVPTLSVGTWLQESGPEFGISPENMEKVRAAGGRAIDSFRMAHEAGVTIVAGTDSGDHACPFGQNARELELYVQNGMTSAEALEAATLHAAELLGLGGEVGVLAPGARADLVIVDGDPLADITVLRTPGRIRTVIKDGADVSIVLGQREGTEAAHVPPMSLPGSHFH